MTDSRDKMLVKALELEEENKRLRAALQSIVDLCPAEGPRRSVVDYDGSWYAEESARHSALEEASSLAAAALVKP